MYLTDTVEADIRSLKIQGATKNALAGRDKLVTVLRELPDVYGSTLETIARTLAYARPTEPLAQNAVRYVFSDPSVPVVQRIAEYRTYIEKSRDEIPVIGKPVVSDGGAYLTLCHSSSAVGLLKAARSSGTYCSVYVAETRPRFQGRITATELLKDGFDDVTMVVDDVAVSLIEGRRGKIDAVFVGADLLTDTGFVNKIGSLAIASAAFRNHIPVYCVTTLLKYDPRPFDPSLIETRDPREIWVDAPPGLQFYSPAFDYVPYFATVHVICEAGILRGRQVPMAVRSRYPFIATRQTEHTYGKSV